MMQQVEQQLSLRVDPIPVCSRHAIGLRCDVKCTDSELRSRPMSFTAAAEVVNRGGIVRRRGETSRLAIVAGLRVVKLTLSGSEIPVTIHDVLAEDWFEGHELHS